MSRDRCVPPQRSLLNNALVIFILIKNHKIIWLTQDLQNAVYWVGCLSVCPHGLTPCPQGSATVLPLSVGKCYNSVPKGQGTTCWSLQLITGLTYRHRQPITLRFTPKANLGHHLNSLRLLLLLPSLLLLVAVVVLGNSSSIVKAKKIKRTCELAYAFRQLTELIMGQVKFL